MGHSISFDTLVYAKKLREAGFTERQAEVQVEALVEVIDENLATKHDMGQIKRDIKELETNLKRDIKELELKFEGNFKLLNWMGGLVLAGIISLVLKAFFV